ncbi:MAG: hypothetical protein CSA65_04915 [Proteobacteria bacterium]|nr:MAG: hypothetical protein CSB49_05585 [Pseudomonadota bacterium]PIE18458.1 MAG: hypothetical protein CSA65_04915 [Pseudomonadota bacterium]
MSDEPYADFSSPPDVDASDEERSLDMDAITAHLDRGWDLLGRGDTIGARLSAHHILQLDADSPEGHTLLGAIVAAEGDPDEAMDLFRRALDADPDYLDALLYAAELAIHPLGDLEQALAFCEDAEDLVRDDDPEALDLILLRAEAHLAAGDRSSAERALAALPALTPATAPDPAFPLRVGRLLLDLEAPKRAIPLLETTLEHPSTRADGRYFLGLALELAGEHQRALEHLVSVHALDLEAPPPSWTLDAESFAALVEQVLGQVEAPFGERLLAVPRRIATSPPLELVCEGFDPRAAVFLAGAPAPSRTSGGESPTARRRSGSAREGGEELQLSCLFIYKRNVERFAGSQPQIGAELFRALIAELGFFYGLDDAVVDGLLDGGGGKMH